MQKNLLIIIFLILGSNWSISAQRNSFEANGSVISYRSFGEGYPVLIINGGPGMNSDGFSSLAELLSDNNTTIIYDQRGTGGSTLKEINSQTISIDLMLEDIEGLRKELGYEKWIVLGHSFGGMLAYAYAAKFPHRVKAMVQSHSGGMDLELLDLLDINSRLSEEERNSLVEHSIKIAQGDTTKATALKRGEILANAYLYNKKNIPQIAERLIQGNSRINSLVWTDMQLSGFDTKAEMKSFKNPVLILQGTDEVAPLEVGKTAHKVLPNSQFIVMEKCGHYGWLERPEIYLVEVRKFLASNS